MISKKKKKYGEIHEKQFSAAQNAAFFASNFLFAHSANAFSANEDKLIHKIYALLVKQEKCNFIDYWGENHQPDAEKEESLNLKVVFGSFSCSYQHAVYE